MHDPIVPIGHPGVLCNYIDKGKVLVNYNYETHSSLKKESLIQFPTSGLVTVWYIYNLYKKGIVKSFDIYGFAFRQAKQDGIAHHYFNDRTKEEAVKRSIVHDLSDESKFIIKILKDKEKNFDKNN